MWRVRRPLPSHVVSQVATVGCDNPTVFATLRSDRLAGQILVVEPIMIG